MASPEHHSDFSSEVAKIQLAEPAKALLVRAFSIEIERLRNLGEDVPAFYEKIVNLPRGITFSWTVGMGADSLKRVGDVVEMYSARLKVIRGLQAIGALPPCVRVVQSAAFQGEIALAESMVQRFREEYQVDAFCADSEYQDL